VKNSHLFYELARTKKIGGPGLRILLLCIDKSHSQSEMAKILEMQRSNVSSTVKKLVSLGALKGEDSHGVTIYSTNLQWKDSELPGQISIYNLVK